MRLLVSSAIALASASFVFASAACSSSSTTSTDAGSPKGDAETTSDGGKSKDAGKATKDAVAVDSEIKDPCSPSAACKVADLDCLGLVDNSKAASFGLRMSQITLAKPVALSTGIVASTIGTAIPLADPSCNLTGAGTFSWLLQLDTAAGTLKTGGARPVADPTTGFAFDDEMITAGATTFHVQPVTFAVTTSAGAFTTSAPASIVMPIFLDAAGTSSVLLPLQMLALKGTVSANHDCIGSYNAAGLDPPHDCQPQGGTLEFANGGSGTGFISLSDADTVAVSALNSSLCVILAGDAATYGMTASGSSETVCKRDAGNNIVFQGDWCAATNSAATSSCADSMAVSFDFAASSVTIND
jgi:hypothetical protein